MYIYPDNMKGRASLFLWRLWDMTLILIGAVISIIIMVMFGSVAPLVTVSLCAFLTIRFEDMCVFDYIVHAFKFCVSTQQFFLWRCGS
jgi:hypothetical protein